jgi:hypothetical protein
MQVVDKTISKTTGPSLIASFSPTRRPVTGADRNRIRSFQQSRGKAHALTQQSTFIVFKRGHDVARSTGQTREQDIKNTFAKAL